MTFLLTPYCQEKNYPGALSLMLTRAGITFSPQQSPQSQTSTPESQAG